MDILGQWIQKVDQFGSAFQPRIRFNSTKHKTVAGGMCTIILYSVSLTYFLYGVIQWQNGQNLPTITISSQTTPYANYTIDTLIASFGNLGQYEAFDSDSMILIPILTQNIGQNRTKSPKVLIPSYGSYNLSDLEFRVDDTNNFIDYTIHFILCSQSTLQSMNISGIKCANKTYSDLFWSSTFNRLEIGVEIQEFDKQSKSIETVLINFSAILSLNTSQYFQINLRQTQTQVDDGILFPENTNYNYISDFSTIGQSADSNYFTSILGYPTLIMVDLMIDDIQIQQSISYPKMNQILADIGSIISIILFLSYIAFMISESSLHNQVCESIIQMYYPEMKQVIIKRNWYGKITSVENSPIEWKYFPDYYKKLSKVAMQKLSVMNWIYELSRLQFIVQNKASKEQQTLIHRYGIKLEPSVKIIQVEKIRESRVVPLHDFTLTPNQKIMEVNDLDQSSEEIVEQKYNLCFNNDDFDLLVHP